MQGRQTRGQQNCWGLHPPGKAHLSCKQATHLVRGAARPQDAGEDKGGGNAGQDATHTRHKDDQRVGPGVCCNGCHWAGVVAGVWQRHAQRKAGGRLLVEVCQGKEGREWVGQAFTCDGWTLCTRRLLLRAPAAAARCLDKGGCPGQQECISWQGYTCTQLPAPCATHRWPM